MSARSIGEIIAPIIAEAIGLARLQELAIAIPNLSQRKSLVMHWWQAGIISEDEAELLIEHNGLEAA